MWTLLPAVSRLHDEVASGPPLSGEKPHVLRPLVCREVAVPRTDASKLVMGQVQGAARGSETPCVLL